MSQPSTTRERSVLVGFLIMLGLSVLLFWLPLIGPFLAGFIGGRYVGSPGRGLVAAILPTLVVAIIVAITGVLTLLPGVGLLASESLVLTAIIQGAPLILGAVIGGATAH